jgi:hypothetical protein
VTSDSTLTKHHRTAILDPDGRGGHYENREAHDESQGGHKDVETAFGRSLELRETSRLEDQHWLGAES